MAKTTVAVADLGRKAKVIEHLFNSRFDPTTKTMANPVVTNDELKLAINHCNPSFVNGLSTNNPANFLKDYLRSPKRNDFWPKAIWAEKYTARQKYREKRVFAFFHAPGQAEPFPDEFTLPADAKHHVIEAVSLPSDARALGRSDEAWLIQVCVHQRVLETHFALYSPLKGKVIDIFHLHNSVKATPEIDAVYLMKYGDGKNNIKALITLEAKRKDFILPDQIRAQVAYMAKQCRDKKKPELHDVDMIVPVAVRGALDPKNRAVAVFDMQPVSVKDGCAAYDAETEHLIPLKIESRVSYTFEPKVAGI